MTQQHIWGIIQQSPAIIAHLFVLSWRLLNGVLLTRRSFKRGLTCKHDTARRCWYSQATPKLKPQDYFGVNPRRLGSDSKSYLCTTWHMLERNFEHVRFWIWLIVELRQSAFFLNQELRSKPDGGQEEVSIFGHTQLINNGCLAAELAFVSSMQVLARCALGDKSKFACL